MLVKYASDLSGIFWFVNTAMNLTMLLFLDAGGDH